MSYKLGQQNQVQHVESGAWIPARFEDGKIIALDEYSPFVVGALQRLLAMPPTTNCKAFTSRPLRD